MFLGAYDDEEAAARAYDLAALKYWGPGTLINFPVRTFHVNFMYGAIYMYQLLRCRID